MNARILIAALALFLSLHATAANINILYVSPTSTGNGAGTLEDPFSTIAAAYGAACQSNTQITIKLLPGVFTENGTLMLTTNKIILEGCGPDQSVIQSLLVFVSNEPCAIANLSIKCVFTNTAMAYLHNVQLPFALSGYTNIVGMWRENMGNGDELRIQGLAEPVNPSDAVTLSFIQYLTNHLDASSIKTGTIAAERIATSIARVSALEATSNHLAGVIQANIANVSNHAALAHLKWSEAGHTIDATMIPSADSMYSNGTNGARWLQVNSVGVFAQTNNIASVAFIGPFGGSVATTNAVYDKSSVTNNGFIYNAPLYEDGKIGKSWDMQGYPGHGASALNFVYSTDVSAYDCFSGKNNFSINMWVKYHSFNDGGSWWQTALCGEDLGYTTKWIWSIDGPTKKFIFHYWGDQSPVLESAEMTIALETWYMFTITRNGTSDDYKFYQNGALISTVNNGGSIDNDPGYLYMGFAEGGVSIDASLDEVTIWSSALNQTAISNLYNSGSGSQVNGTEGSLVGAYTFDNDLTPGTALPKTDDELQIDGSAFVHGRVKGHPATKSNEFVVLAQMTNAIATTVGAAAQTYVDGKQFVASNIAASSISTAKIATNAVTATQLADGAITSNKIAASMDARYIRRDTAAQQTMAGTLEVPDFSTTSTNDWQIGSEGKPNVNILMTGPNSKITTVAGKSLVLASQGPEVVVKTNLVCDNGIKMNGMWAGLTTAVTTGGSATYRTNWVAVAGMDTNSVVILTFADITDANHDGHYSAVPCNNGFVLYFHEVMLNHKFSYLVIKK